MTQRPGVYADLLGKKLAAHPVDCWLVNTGWTGGPYGTGHRIPIGYTRATIGAAINGVLNEISTRKDPVFGFEVPTHCPNVPDEILTPRATWADPGAYDSQAHKLARMFIDNFKQFEGQVPASLKSAGPGG
jgi:phosphoenolpyruvate carboxykinase (ATP)